MPGRKRLTRHRVLIAVMAVLLCLCLGNQRSLAERSPLDYSFDVWQTEDGLPYNSVTSIVQTRDGYIWLGTYNGLVRFDGVRFTVFDTSNTPQLKSSRVTSLFEDRAGNLWIGHETGDLTRLANGHFNHVALGGGWPGGEITAINADEAGDLWLLNNAGWLLRVKDEHSIPTGKGAAAERVTTLVKEKGGKLWALRESSPAAFENGQLAPWLPAGSHLTNTFQWACASRNGGLWVASNGRVKKWSALGWGEDLGPTPWGQNTVLAMVETKTGDLLTGTLQSGLYLMSTNGVSRQFSRTNGLSHDWVRCLYSDREGNLWAGTGGGGLDALRVRTVGMAHVPDDWQGRGVLGVTPSAAGGLWVGTEGAGLYWLNNGDSERFAMTNGLYNVFDWSVLEDADGLWVGTWGSGLYIREGDTFRQPVGMDPGAAVTALFKSRDGALWLGTAEGLGCYKNGELKKFTRKDGLALPDVRTITQDGAGAIWFGMSGGGLGRLKDGKLNQFRKEDGLASDFVWSLQAEPEDALWIGTFGGGLCRLKNGHFATISTREGLPNNVICHIADDGHGNFWISSYGGIFRVAKSALDLCADGRQRSVYCFTYGKADGLATLECSGGFQPAGCQTPDGRLWIPTTKGLAVVDPAKVSLNPLPPPVVIEEVTVDGELAAVPQVSTPSPGFQLEVKPGKQRFEFRYAGLSLTAPEKVRFRYRLDGLETDWIEAGSRRVAYYSYLKPGEYQFRVIACNNDGIWNEEGAALPIKVLPYFWQTWWFSILAVLAGTGAVGATARYTTRRRLRQRMEKLERQRAIERERARIAKDIHDDLGASLTRIILLSQSGHSDLEEPHAAAADLDQIYLIARELTRAMDEIVWAVSPQHDTLDSLVTYLGKFAQDFLSVAGIRCRLNVPIELPSWPITAEVRHNLFLATKEALHNVLKHAAATEVRISLTLAPAGFCLLVDDNGKGFDPNVATANAPSQPANYNLRFSTGSGSTNMRKRLEEIGGVFELKSAPGEGTNVKFMVPVKN